MRDDESQFDPRESSNDEEHSIEGLLGDLASALQAASSYLTISKCSGDHSSSTEINADLVEKARAQLQRAFQNCHSLRTCIRSRLRS